MAQMLQKPVFTLPGCQRMSVNTLLCDTLGLADNLWPFGPFCHCVGNFYLSNLKKIQIGIGIGKLSVINSEELQIGNLLGTDPRKG